MMSKTQSIIISVSVLILMTAGSISAQISPEELFESGVYKHEVEGDLQGAIEVFEQIVTEHAQNRPLAARALLHLGASYEKLGNQRAQDAYQRLISEFGDQQAVVSEARMRLQEMRYRELAEGIQSKGAGPTYRMALDEETPGGRPLTSRQYDFSPDGTQIAYQSKEGLFVSDASGTLHRQLVAQSDDPKDWFIIFFRVGQPRWSPDGKQIAYFAGKRRPPGDDPNDLIWTIFLIDSEGGEPRQLVESLDPEPYSGLNWTSNGKGLTYMSLEGVKVLDLNGRTVNEVNLDVEHHSTTLYHYSPDGRWFAIHQKADPESGNNENTDIYLVPASGGEMVQLTFEPGYDGSPVWGSDSRSVYFISARLAKPLNTNIWKVNIDGKTGEPIGNPEQVTFFNDARVTHLQAIGDGSKIAFTLDKTKNSVHVAPDSNTDEYRTLARGVNPELSPDGKTVYYIGEGPDHQGIYAIPAEGGQPSKLTSAMPVAGRKDLSPDGSTLAYFMDDDNGRGLYTLPVTGGEPRQLLEIGCSQCCMSPHWSRDGEWLTYASGDGLYLISAAGGEPKKLATLPNWEQWTLKWSPDGKYIAALAYQEGEMNNAVYIVPMEGGEARLLSDFDDYKEGLEWHPDGQSLTYHISETKSETRRTWLDGRPIELFLDKPDGWDYVGRWSPDGKRFFLTNARETDWYMDIYDIDTKEYTPFVASDASLPSWSGDNKTMVWTTEQKIRQLWVMENFK